MEALRPVLGQHIAPCGWVACWVTNSKSAREGVREAFEVWAVEVVEEWYWVKVTRDGEPVTEVGGLWRRPWEVLLLGRKVGEGKAREGGVKKRIIVGVPDVHSRKPCLKEIFEEVMGSGKIYRALEVFARGLTAGWWAWGDECLRWQWEGWWSESEEVEGFRAERETQWRRGL